MARETRNPDRAAAHASVAPGSLFPTVLTCEHATNRLPPGIRPGREERRILNAHWGWDIGAWDLTRGVARRLGTTAIGGRWSRLWIDLNRRVDDPTLIREWVDGTELSWNRGLGPVERERRVLDDHGPYHEAIDRVIVRRLVRGMRPLLLAVHTFTADYVGRSRPFDAGVLYERDGRLAQALARTLRESGLSIRYNEPYSGMAGMMYSVDRHGKHHGLPCLELELNQSLFERRGAVPHLTRLVERAVRDMLASTAQATLASGSSRPRSSLRRRTQADRLTAPNTRKKQKKKPARKP